jgi:signal peptidase I
MQRRTGPENGWLMRGSPPHPSGRAGPALRAGLALLAAALVGLALSACGGSGHASAAAVTSTTATSPSATTGEGAGTSTTASPRGRPAGAGKTGTGSAGTSGSGEASSAGGSATGAPGAGGASASAGGGTGSKDPKAATPGGRSGAAGKQKGAGGHGAKGTTGSGTAPAAVPGTGAAGSSSGGGTTEPVASQYTYEVRSVNMEPTYKPYAKLYYDPGDSMPTAGQIVVFHPPEGALEGSCGENAPPQHACREATAKLASTLDLGRVVAVGGNSVAFQEGDTILDGSLQNESAFTNACGKGPACSFSAPITVPAGAYYILYDNRGALDDSRIWGAVPQAGIVGVVNGTVSSS